MNKRKILLIIKIMVISYCTIGIVLYYFQEKILFHPKKLPVDHTFNFNTAFEEVQIPINKTDTISMVKFFTPDSVAKGVVLYFHGNMENVEHYGSYVSVFTRNGYEVWMPDYPGFGKSTGERNEKKMYELAWLVQKMAVSKYDPNRIVIYGKSLGTGFAAYAASVLSSKQLILETPYYSIPDMFDHYAFIYPTTAMCTYKIPTWKFLQEVKSPVTIFHGTKDDVIDIGSAEKLKPFLKPADQFIIIKDGKHNDLTGYEIYQRAMDSLLGK